MANLLGGKERKTPQEIAQAEAEAARRISELNERTRLLEERNKQLMQKLQVIDETMIKKINDIRNKIKNLESQITETRKDSEEIKEIVRRIVKDLGQTAKLSDVKVLEKYINMVDITRIVTKEDVFRYIEEYLEEHKKKRKG
jgi:DNA repair exonuclease SbcCD ATPase subunit